MPDLGQFHFLRPWWLLGLLAATALFSLIRWRDDPTRAWRGFIEPHLLAHLRSGRGVTGWFRPIHLIVALLMLGCLGAAGPTWQREITPFSEDKAPLLIVLDLSESMNAIDVAPTRLERAKQKVRDLLALRAGARTGLIAYAGTAHLVLPLTDDARVIETYLMALEGGLMPLAGKRPSQALALADSLLAEEEIPGSILFVTDGISTEELPAFVEHRRTSSDSLLVLAVGTSEGGPIRSGDGFASDATGRRRIARLDREGLEQLASETGAFVASVTLDERDVERVQRRVQSHLEATREEDPSARWRDAGYYLVYPVVLLLALWFRRGWTVRWAGLLLIGLLSPAPASAAEWRFADLWLTPDQQGRQAFEQGDFQTAAERFEEPMWKGVACYRAGDWDCAIDAFARSETPEAYFNLAGAFAQRGDYELAVAAYDEALETRPDWNQARENRERVAALLERPDEENEEGEPGDPTFDADEIKFDDKGKKGKEGEIDQTQLTNEQMSEIWLRGLQTSPAAFLARKFAIQAAEAEEGP